jgi:predicted component of type VI protein secretion system
MNVNPLIDFIKQNFSDFDSLRQLETAIECMIEEREYRIKLLNGESPEWPDGTISISSVLQVNNQK